MNSGQRNRFSIRARLASIRFAVEGINSFLRTQHNAIVHLFFTVFVMAAAFFFDVSSSELTAIIVVTALVWVAELFNSAIEAIMDFIEPRRRPQVKLIKDMSAAAVFVAALAAVVVGIIIFIPKVF